MRKSQPDNEAVADSVALVRREADGIPIVPVVLSGGSGTRLWPLSRRLEPKQFQRLASDRATLFQDTLRRFGEPCFASALVIANAEQEPMLRRDTTDRTAGLAPTFMLEPCARSTAAPIACAALLLAERGDTDAMMMVTPSDHHVKHPEKLYEAIASAVSFVRNGSIALFGIEPTRPETGFGYIRVGPMEFGAVRRVEGFVEKPDAATASQFLATRRYLWNSGMFLFTARTIIEEFETHLPGVLATARSALEPADRRGRWIRLGPAFEAMPDAAIDTAVMEKSRRLGVVPVMPGWSDLGTFHALWQEGEKDADGNVVSGQALLHDVSNSYVHAEGRRVCVYGVSDLCVVETPDAILVGPHAGTTSIKRLVDRLTAAGDPSVSRHVSGAAHQDGEIVRIDIEPAGSELLAAAPGESDRFLKVVSGQITLTSLERIMILGVGEAVHAGAGDALRLFNHGLLPSRIVVVRTRSFRQLDTDTAPAHDPLLRDGYDAATGELA